MALTHHRVNQITRLSTPAIDAALSNPCVSYWLQDALRAALTRDCVDAVHDAERLAQLLRERLDAILSARKQGES